MPLSRFIDDATGEVAVAAALEHRDETQHRVEISDSAGVERGPDGATPPSAS